MIGYWLAGRRTGLPANRPLMRIPRQKNAVNNQL